MTQRHAICHPEVAEDLASIVASYAERDPALPGRFRARLGEQTDQLLRGGSSLVTAGPASPTDDFFSAMKSS